MKLYEFLELIDAERYGDYDVAITDMKGNVMEIDNVYTNNVIRTTYFTIADKNKKDRQMLELWNSYHADELRKLFNEWEKSHEKEQGTDIK